jgi:hypothetical protein
VTGGLVVHGADRSRDLLRFTRDYAARASDELCIVALLRIAPPAPLFPRELHGRPIAAVALCHIGDPRAAEKELAALRGFGDPAVDTVKRLPFVDHQRMLDATQPPGHLRYWKSRNLPALCDDAIDAIVEHASTITSPQSLVALFQLGGAVSRVPEDATAYSGRSDAFTLNIASAWLQREESETHIEWTRRFYAAMEPHATGVYGNFEADPGDGNMLGAAKRRRLVDLKRRYDPDNFFRLNHNVDPSRLT